MRSLSERFYEKIELIPFHPCWEWMGHIGEKGYGFIGIRAGRSMKAHRASWQIHFGPIPAGLFVCHRCDNPSCVRPDHLFLGTAKDNVRDMMQKKRSAFEKLSHEQVVEIRTLLTLGKSLRTIAKLFGTSCSNVWAIKHSKTWRS